MRSCGGPKGNPTFRASAISGLKIMFQKYYKTIYIYNKSICLYNTQDIDPKICLLKVYRLLSVKNALFAKVFSHLTITFRFIYR